MSTPRQVTLMGREFRIKTDEDANHVQAVADYVNAKIDEQAKPVAKSKKKDRPAKKNKKRETKEG